MHIPDGYLSPETCAALYAGAVPFWWISLRRVRRVLNTRMVPLLSLFSAFCFTIMMFNLPLPGGTTGHALGVTVAAIVLGPWASILAVSIALLTQALLFGDGGITTLGANCFNMAIVGSLVAYGVYRLISGRTALTAGRRVVAAATAGYVAINAAAVFAAVEFGIQPMLFHDASGTPLYAPYPIHIAVPAMMIGHLTFADMAELFLSAGIVAWLQRTNVSLLKATAPGCPELEREGAAAAVPRLGRLRPLWLGLAVLLLLTPLGVLASGAAWGEWSAQDFRTPEIRQQIAKSSHNQAPPADVPAGLRRLSSVWTAPFPAYAPQIVRSERFGYMLSGMFGVGLIILLTMLTSRLFGRKIRAGAQPGDPKAGEAQP